LRCIGYLLGLQIKNILFVELQQRHFYGTSYLILYRGVAELRDESISASQAGSTGGLQNHLAIQQRQKRGERPLSSFY
jgi:hypothetical protein